MPDEAFNTVAPERTAFHGCGERLQLLSVIDVAVKEEDPAHIHLLLCPGNKQDVVCLLGNGEEKWRIPRIWEYDRSDSGGPDFYITRFGSNFYHEGLADGTFDREAGVSGQDWKRKIENAKKEIAAARHAFYEKYNGWITAGPIVTEDFRSQAFLGLPEGERVMTVTTLSMGSSTSLTPKWDRDDDDSPS